MSGGRIRICGAGPAGLIVGLQLQRQDIASRILEKNKCITTSACGGGVSLDCLGYLKKLTGFDSEPFIEKHLKGVKLHYPNNYHSFTFKPSVILDRQKWLEALSREYMQAGGQIEFNTNPQGYDVDCSGPSEGVTAVKYVLDSVFGDDFLNLYLDKRFSTHYSWIFPEKHTTNIGLVGKFKQLDDFIEAKDITGRIISKSAGLIPYGNYRLYEDGVFYLGDSGGMCNPLTLAGLAPIIYASEILVKNLRKPENYINEIQNHDLSHKSLMQYTRKYTSLPNPELEKIGWILHQNQTQLDPKTLLKTLRHPQITPTLKLMHKAIQKTKKYGW